MGIFSKISKGFSGGLKLGVGPKLYFSLGILIILTIASSVVSLISFNKTADLVDSIVKTDLVSLADSNTVSASFGELNAHVAEIGSVSEISKLLEVHESVSLVLEVISEQIKAMSLSEADNTQLENLVGSVTNIEAALFATRKSVIEEEASLSRRVKAVGKTHSKLAGQILPIYDDAQFALLIEMDDALAEGPEVIKALVEDKAGMISSMLKLMSSLNEIQGIYLATHSVSDRALLVPFLEKYVAASGQCKDIIDGFSDDSALVAIAVDVKKFLDFGKGQRSIFNAVTSLLKKKEKLKNFERTIKENEGQMGALFAALATDVKESSVESADGLLKQLTQSRRFLGALSLVFLFAVGVIVFAFIRPKIVSRIKALSVAMEAIRGGDLAYEVDVSGVDEIAQMSGALVRFKDDALKTREMELKQKKDKDTAEADKKKMMKKLANDFEVEVKSIVSAVAESAMELSEAAQKMTMEISNSADIARDAGKSSMETNETVQSVASVSEELSASVREVSSQTQRTNVLVDDSVVKTEDADNQAQALGQATQRVKEVVELISNISGQINLLALNATIEAARAGDAGRGFAVVASEVKNLASQTDNSIDEIISVIEGMDSASEDIIASLALIRGSVQNISDASQSVATVVEQQTSVANEISSNMQVASQSVKVTAESLDNVMQTATSASASAEQILGASQVLSGQAENLNEKVENFLTQIRA